MKQFLLYAHGGSYNHGAEAILRSTLAMIGAKYSEARILVSTHYPDQDRQFGIKADVLIAPDYQAWEQEKKAKTKVEKMQWARRMYSAALARITSDTTLLSIGGDNYCYQNWHRLAVFQEEAVKQGAKTILWGASIEPAEITNDMVKVLNTYTYILARESITYHALLQKGIRAQVCLLPDPAFSLPSQETVLPAAAGKYVGINLSPLVVRRERRPGILYENLRSMVTMILDLGMEVALIPHVTVKADNDCDALQRLCDQSRVHLVVGNFCASQYKYIISNCAVLVCARTHASIAAYSSGVPVLTLGYSVKAAGIANDLGVPETVINIKDVETPYVLCEAFQMLYSKREFYRNHFSRIMPCYQKKMESYAQYL